MNLSKTQQEQWTAVQHRALALVQAAMRDDIAQAKAASGSEAAAFAAGIAAVVMSVHGLVAQGANEDGEPDPEALLNAAGQFEAMLDRFTHLAGRLATEAQADPATLNRGYL